MPSNPKPNVEGYVVLHSSKTKKWYMGFDARDGGVRVDYHGDLEDLTVHDAYFEKPDNVWGSPFIPLGRRDDLIPRYS